jgi:hypothetical protein
VRLRLALARAAVLVVSLALSLLLAEGAVRLLDRYELLPRGALQAFPEVPFSGAMRASANSRLFVELDPASPLVNSDGFRDRSYAVARGDEVRIVVLGDSVTFGRGVALERVYTEVLEDRLNAQDPGGPRYEVLNFGAGGYNTEQEIELYEVKARKYAPDLVLVGFVLNDCYPANWMNRRKSGRAAGATRGSEGSVVPAALRPPPSGRATASRGSVARGSRLLALVRERLLSNDRGRGANTRRVIQKSCADPDNWRMVRAGL